MKNNPSLKGMAHGTQNAFPHMEKKLKDIKTNTFKVKLKKGRTDVDENLIEKYHQDVRKEIHKMMRRARITTPPLKVVRYLEYQYKNLGLGSGYLCDIPKDYHVITDILNKTLDGDHYPEVTNCKDFYLPHPPSKDDLSYGQLVPMRALAKIGVVLECLPSEQHYYSRIVEGFVGSMFKIIYMHLKSGEEVFFYNGDEYSLVEYGKILYREAQTYGLVDMYGIVRRHNKLEGIELIDSIENIFKKYERKSGIVLMEQYQARKYYHSLGVEFVKLAKKHKFRIG